MNGALIYRPSNRKLVWLAFWCAITIHVGAIAVAGSKSKPAPPGPIAGIEDVVGEDVPPSAPEETDALPPEQPAIVEQDFYEEKTTPIHPRKKMPTAPVRATAGTR